MKRRCPTSTYLGIARLKGYRWIVNKRGYANIVETHTSPQGHSNEVWGLVFELQPADEAQLDINEGVPEAYTKEDMLVDFWPAKGDHRPDVSNEPQRINMLAYIDGKRIEPDVPKKEYIYRMNEGIKDAVEEGVPASYVDEIIRKFIPATDKEDIR